jgi:hypothetical protein
LFTHKISQPKLKLCMWTMQQCMWTLYIAGREKVH